MILVDTGPFVALFDPKDALHERCKAVLKVIREPLYTTVPVLTEAFHMLSPGSYGADRLRDFILAGTAHLTDLNRSACFNLEARISPIGLTLIWSSYRAYGGRFTALRW